MTFNKVNWREREALWVELLSENFKDDPLYAYIFKDSTIRKGCLEVFFKAYLTYLQSSSTFYLSQDLKACGVLFISDDSASKAREALKVLRMLVMMLPLVAKVGFYGYIRCLRTLYVMSSQWIDALKIHPYAHMDLKVVSKDARGRGYFRQWLDIVVTSFSLGYTITLETQSLDNVRIYNHCGFDVVVEIPLKKSPLVQYGMVYQTNRRST